MPLEVLIATPSGPFGELIRLSLEADPEFHCALFDKSADIREAVQKTRYQAVIFDCSFTQPEPAEVVQLVHDEIPSAAVLLVQPENRPDISPIQNIQFEGWITRPFDASVLPEKVRAAIKKRGTPQVLIDSVSSPQKPASWWNLFQSGIKETAASNGLIIQNGMVIASTPGTTTALQQQVTASVMRFWNPKDSADLMRYVKDLVTGQEWMMYATHAADTTVLVLLFLPQTPITKVRSQTLSLAKDVSVLMAKTNAAPRKPNTGILEPSEAPRLQEILGETPGEPASRVNKKEFPVEWFKEVDLPDFSQTDIPVKKEPFTLDEKHNAIGIDQPVDSRPQDSSFDQEEDFMEFEASFLKETGGDPISVMDKTSGDLDFVSTPLDDGLGSKIISPDLIPNDQADIDAVSGIPIPEAKLSDVGVQSRLSKDLNEEAGKVPEVVSAKPVEEETTDLTSSNDLDLGIFEEFYLHSQPSGESNLGEMQPISLEVKKSDVSPIEPSINEQLGLVVQPVNEKPPVSEPDALSNNAAINLADQLPAGFDNEDMFVIPREPLFEIPSELPVIDTGVMDDQTAEELVSAKLPPLDFFTGSEPDENAVLEPLVSELPALDFFTGSEPVNETTTESLAAELPALDFFTSSDPVNKVTSEPSTAELPDFDFFSGAISDNEAVVVSTPVELPPLDFFTGSEPVADSIFKGAAEPVRGMVNPLKDELVLSDEILPPIVQAEQSSNKVLSFSKPGDEPIPFASNATEQDLYTRMNQLEAAPPAENWETYTVAMIPQSESDILVRQIAGALNQAMYRLCLAFNWNLENLTIRPTYMQWTVSIPIALSPEDMIAIVRKETTQEINKIDTGQTPQRPRDEFWSPESMSVAGKDFSPSIHWQDFILRRKNREIA